MLVVKVGHRLAPSLERGRSVLVFFSTGEACWFVKVGHRQSPRWSEGAVGLNLSQHAGCECWSPSSALAGARAQLF